MTTLAGVLPETAAAYDALSRYAATQGITIGVANYGGVRTAADTAQIVQYRADDYAAAQAAGTIRPDTTLQAFRPIAPFGLSYHNYGAAFDVRIVARPAGMTEAGALKTLANYAPSVGLRWGGYFHNPDPPHFELAITLADAQARYRANAPGAALPFALPFDISNLLPGLTPTGDDVAATLDLPDVTAADDAVSAEDDAGDVALDDLPPETGDPSTMIMLGLVVAGVMWWALRRKLS